MIDERAGWYGHEHSRHATDGHHRADGTRRPATLLEENA